jgi:DNA-binding MarR family transcriptional regulator
MDQPVSRKNTQSRRHSKSRSETTAAVSQLLTSVSVGGRSPAYSAREIHRLYKIALASLLANDGITIGNWYYLRALWQQDGISQQELSTLVGVSSTTAVPAIDNMERAGLIARVPDPTDRRKFKVVLTTKGRALQEKLVPPAEELLRRSLRKVSKRDLEVFFCVVEQIKVNLLAELKAPLDMLD